MGKGLKAGIGGLAALALLAVPTWAWANPLPPFNLENLPIVLWGEMVPLMLETMLLRRWLKLPWRTVFPVVLLANVVSVGASLIFAAGMFLPELLAENMDAFYFVDWRDQTLYVPRFDESMDVWQFLLWHFGSVMIFTVIAIGVELPVYWWNLQPRTDASVARLSALANLISYPLYYALVIIGILVYTAIAHVVH